MKINPLSKIKPLHKLNREFMIDMLSNENEQENEYEQDMENGAEEAEEKEIIKINEIYEMNIEPSDTKPKPMKPEPEPEHINIHKNLDLRSIFENEPEFKTKSKRSKKKHNIFSFISDILFYLAILTVMVAILTSGSKDGSPRTFLGKYAYFTVVSPSMQDELPVGSFILVKKTDPHDLKIDDNITFMKDAHTTVTHKIIGIYENYNDSGARGFQTKGTNNINPDAEIVYEANVVGKVIFNVPKAGAVISALKANIYIIFLIFGIFVIASFLLRMLFRQIDKQNPPEKIKKP